MITPDKIYLSIGSMSGNKPCKKFLYAEWYEEPKPLVDNIAYIRKDALLEWARQKLEKFVKLQYDSNQDPTYWGQRNAFQQIIDKINSI